MPIKRYGKRRRAKRKHMQKRRLKENYKPYMWNPDNAARQDSVLKEAYKLEEERSMKSRAQDLRRTSKNAFRREEVRDDPKKLEKWLRHPEQYDIIGVDGADPKPYVPERKEVLYHGTTTESAADIIIDKKLETPPIASWSRIKSSGLTTNYEKAEDFGSVVIEFSGERLARKNRLVKVKYSREWFENNPEYARRVAAGEMQNNAENPTQQLVEYVVGYEYEKEITSRRPIKFSYADIQIIRVKNSGYFRKVLKYKLEQKVERGEMSQKQATSIYKTLEPKIRQD